MINSVPMAPNEPNPSDARTHWDRRYRESDAAPRPADEFLVQAFTDFIQPAFPRPGEALDLAGGAGRHALYLAEHGWRVTLADISPAAIAQARASARRRRLSLTFLLGDTRELDFGREAFDLILGFFYLDRPAFPKIVSALRPGGLVIYQTFTREHRKFATMGVTRPTYFLHQQELRQTFAAFDLLFYDENSREPGLARLIARKPPG